MYAYRTSSEVGQCNRLLLLIELLTCVISTTERKLSRSNFIPFIRVCYLYCLLHKKGVFTENVHMFCSVNK